MHAEIPVYEQGKWQYWGLTVHDSGDFLSIPYMHVQQWDFRHLENCLTTSISWMRTGCSTQIVRRAQDSVIKSFHIKYLISPYSLTCAKPHPQKPWGSPACWKELSAPLTCIMLHETQPINCTSAKKQGESLQVYYILPTFQTTSGLSD